MDILKTASAVPTMETKRLVMRKITADDARDLYRYAKKKKVTRYLTWFPHPSLRYTRAYVDLLQQKYESGEFYDWGLHLKQSDRMIGTCGITRFDLKKGEAEIGYVISPRVWGRGYAAEAASQVIRFCFDTLKLNAVTARFIYGNTQSEAVMQKLGMTSRGFISEPMFIKNQWVSVVEYALTRREYESKH